MPPRPLNRAHTRARARSSGRNQRRNAQLWGVLNSLKGRSRHRAIAAAASVSPIWSSAAERVIEGIVTLVPATIRS
jgi:hypothetical protein